MEVKPKSHPVNQLEFNVIIGADGRRNTLPGDWTSVELSGSDQSECSIQLGLIKAENERGSLCL